MGNVDQLLVVREGTYLYAQSVPIQVRIVTSPETWGTGDYEDEDAIAENKSTPCFFVLYEMAGKPGEFCNAFQTFQPWRPHTSFVVRNSQTFNGRVTHVCLGFPNTTRSVCPHLHNELPNLAVNTDAAR